MIVKTVITTVDVLMALLCVIAGHKENDYVKFVIPIVFILVNIGGMWI